MSSLGGTSRLNRFERYGHRRSPLLARGVTEKVTATEPKKKYRKDEQYNEIPKDSITRLPNEVLLLIGEYMNENRLAAMVQNSRFMRKLFSPRLYTKACKFAPADYTSVTEWAAGKGRVDTIRKVFEQMPTNANWARVVSVGIAAAIMEDQVCTLQFLASHLSNPLKELLLIDSRGASVAESAPNPVALAAYAGSVEVLRYLLENGVSFTMPPLQAAALMFEGRGRLSGDTQVAQVLMQHGFDIRARNDIGRTLLHDLAMRGSCAHVNLVVAAAPECLNQQDEHGRTPLMHAIVANQYPCAIYMVTSARADVTRRNYAGATALHLAVKGSNIQLVKALIECGADINARDGNQRTPLHVATDTYFGSIREPQMVAVLLEYGAFCSPVDKNGNTPLGHALAARDARMVNWLAVGAIHHAYEFEKTEVLLEACQVGNTDIVRLYAEREGFDIQQHEDDWQRSALHLAALGGYAEVVSFLLQNWRDVERRDTTGRTALWYAAKKMNHASVNQLIEAGASVDQRDDCHYTPLMNLTRHVESPEAMLRFLKLSRNIEAIDLKGRTLLHHAARNGNVHATQAVADFRPSLLGQRDGQQESALLTAITHNRTKVIQFLGTVMTLTPGDFRWLSEHGYTESARWIVQGPEWMPTRRLWCGLLREEEDDEDDEDVEEDEEEEEDEEYEEEEEEESEEEDEDEDEEEYDEEEYEEEEE